MRRYSRGMTEPDEDETPRESERARERDDQQANRGALGRVTAHMLALEASDRAWDDARIMHREPLLRTIAEQLMKSASAISAHIADGYGRRSPRDRIRFYETPVFRYSMDYSLSLGWRRALLETGDRVTA